MNKDWIKVENFISKDTAKLLYQYIKFGNERLSFLKSKGITVASDIYGMFNDPQSEGDLKSPVFAMYGDLIFDTLMVNNLEKIENIIDTKLTPQYSFYRLYTEGTELKRHTDRESCEISSTLCLGYDADYSWPIWFKDRDGNEISIETEPGDMIIYKGCDLEHWREPFKGNNHAQVFLHYNIKDGKYNNIKDGRPIFGIPHISLTKDWFKGNIFVLTDEEKSVIVDGEFRKALSKQGNAISKSAEVLEDEKLLRLKTHILTVFNDYVVNHLQIENQFYLTQSWTAINHKGDAHHSHIHPNTVFSCVYYVQANSGDLQIKMPLSRIQEGYNISYKILQQNIFNCRTINLSVKTGDVVIFPGWCEHKALPNEDDSPRIILGTNYFLTGTFGDYDNKDEITIR